MIEVVDLAATFLAAFLSSHGKKLPGDIVSAVQAAIDALVKHKNDLITKANLEAQRG